MSGKDGEEEEQEEVRETDLRSGKAIRRGGRRAEMTNDGRMSGRTSQGGWRSRTMQEIKKFNRKHASGTLHCWTGLGFFKSSFLNECQEEHFCQDGNQHLILSHE